MLLASLVITAALVRQTQPADVPLREREVLMELFAATGGEQWKNHGGWGSTLPVCNWAGVFCDDIDYNQDRPTVTWLLLEFNNLRGTVPASVGTLPNLKKLNLVGNALTGSVAEEILQRWDRHLLDFEGRGNRFANMIASASVRVQSGGVLCSQTADRHYIAEFDATSMKATMESVQDSPLTSSSSRRRRRGAMGASTS